ncbi:transglutaminase domain-containing protein [Thalassotalea litorea]|uniref:transglutaminase domain-containing protein n=1 Tax=Thalassotalea litorea TaxID=2020715 RepID=UPI0037365AA1
MPECKRFKSLLFLTILNAVALVQGCDDTQQHGLNEKPTKVSQQQSLIKAGKFAEARASIQQQLEGKKLSVKQREGLQFELERMDRIEQDFSADLSDIRAYIEKHIGKVSDQELAKWQSEGLLEHRIIDGQTKYFRSAGYNLFQLDEQALKRRKGYVPFTDRAPLYALHQHHKDIVSQVDVANTQVEKKRFKIRYSLTVNANAVPQGEMVKAWIPFPRNIEGRQENIRYLDSSPKVHQIASEESLQRTIYFETPAVEDKPTEFWVEYEYDTYAVSVPVEPEQVTAVMPDDALMEYLQQRPPHVVFTPEIQALSERIVGDETNPYKIAQKLFTYVDNIPWATAIEYSTIPNISEYAMTAGHADCGQQTMLLITLLRYNGIPARWQSGWEFSPKKFDTMHDWGMVYFAPYGWVPMDVTHGVLDSDEEALKWFYLSGIDSYRLIFNDDYSQGFEQAKQHFRSETVDSQRGEVEWQGGNLYFNQWRYDMQWQDISDELVSEQAVLSTLAKPDFLLPELDSDQVVMVITDDENAIQGKLFSFEKQIETQNNPTTWKSANIETDIVVGKTGIAWGKGLHPEQPGKQKQEGDGKAPAGVFRLGTAFGYLPDLPTGLNYEPMTASHFCMDVGGSPLYNQIADTKVVGEQALAGNSEPMRRDIHKNDQVYKKGIFVHHNPDNLAGSGSCIFIHLWRSDSSPTLGCTAMDETAMDKLLAWLDKDKNPLMVTLTKAQYESLKRDWRLPEIPAN